MKTSKGTELPLSNIKGKDYLEVKYRIMWFREDHIDWSIETEFVFLDAQASFAKATIRDQNGRVIATAHKHEDSKGFADHREKAETGAIGRALSLLGYGTVNALDLEEGDRIVDAPVSKNIQHINDYSGDVNLTHPPQLFTDEPWPDSEIQPPQDLSPLHNHAPRASNAQKHVGGMPFKTISEAQAKRLNAIGKKSGFSFDQIDQVVLTIGGVERLTSIKKEDYDGICDWLDKNSPAELDMLLK